MNKKIKLVVACLFACICHLPAVAQSGKLFNTDNQLSSNLATQVYQDTITKYYVENGIQSNEFSDGAACATPDHRFIVMAGTGGINFFEASRVKQHPWSATVKLSGFLLGNKHVVPFMESGSYTITEKGVYDTKEFNLAHDDNSFTLQFSTLSYNNVEQIVYAYSINDEEWRKVQSGSNEISFSHLPPGTYHFKVKAICNSYETPIKEFTIIVHPAWYAGFWAKCIYFLIFFLLINAYMRHRKRQEEDRLVLQQHIHAEEMGEAKLRFFMNISHEIRTPLTLILTPLLSLIKEDKDPHRQSIYDLMHKNSERILHLINQMMDLRKIDKDKLETIFQRFYQSPTNPNDRNVGTGIGLDLTRSLVELHSGTIIARNNAGGARFRHARGHRDLQDWQ